MNGDDVKILRNDLGHLTRALQELKVDLRSWQALQNERLSETEQANVALYTWKNGHIGEHDRISRKLSALEAVPVLMLRMEGDIKSLKGDVRRFSIVTGGIVAAIVTAIGQIIVAILKLV